MDCEANDLEALPFAIDCILFNALEQFYSWNQHITKLALGFFLLFCPFKATPR